MMKPNLNVRAGEERQKRKSHKHALDRGTRSLQARGQLKRREWYLRGCRGANTKCVLKAARRSLLIKNTRTPTKRQPDSICLQSRYPLNKRPIKRDITNIARRRQEDAESTAPPQLASPPPPRPFAGGAGETLLFFACCKDAPGR
eukprot:4359355-Pleurochrysis_carterae.AAC.3